MSETLIKVEGVSKKFCRSLKQSLWYGMKDLGNELIGHCHGGSGKLRPEEFWAVNDVSFELKRGECLGLIGRNGAGKTTLLRMLNGLIKPDAGRIEMRGKVGALIALGAGFNPILTGRENIFINASVLGLSKRETEEKLDEIIDFAEIGEFIDMPVQSYSSGMQVRLGFAVATTLKADILLLDEVLAVGDAEFRTKSFSRIGKLLSTSCVIFVSHNEAQIKRICNSAVYLRKGRVRYAGDVDEALGRYHCEAHEEASGNAIPAEPAWLLHDNLASVEAIIGPKELCWGGNIEMELHVEAKEDVAVSKAYIQFARRGENVAHTENDFDKQNGMTIKKGKNTMRFTVSNVSLARGTYTVSVAIFGEGGKTTLAHALNAATLAVSGRSVGVGPATLFPCSCSML